MSANVMNRKRPKLDDDLDGAVIGKLPPGSKIVAVKQSGPSIWIGTVRIRVQLEDGKTAKYFKKEASGAKGASMMAGAYAADSALYAFVPELVPQPLAHGAYTADPNTHFYLCEYVKMKDDLPSAKDWAAAVSQMHIRSKGQGPPTHFGFHVTTYLANVPVNNAWDDSWAAFWTQQMRGLFEQEDRKYREDGQDLELTRLKNAFLEQVIPRYLDPLESGGRTVTPCLIHSDLWPGNIKPRADGTGVCLFDACAYWGHHEADLGICRNPRYKLGLPVIEEYRKLHPLSEPVEEFDERNAVYAMKFHVLLSTMYFEDERFRDVLKSELRLLVEKAQKFVEKRGESPGTERCGGCL